MIGIDLVFLPRFRNILMGRFGEKFCKLIYTKSELESAAPLCQNERIRFLAGRFAAKESAIKASMGKLSLKSIGKMEVRQQTAGNIEIFLIGEKMINKFGDASISHDEDNVVAVVIRDANSSC